MTSRRGLALLRRTDGRTSARWAGVSRQGLGCSLVRRRPDSACAWSRATTIHAVPVPARCRAERLRVRPLPSRCAEGSCAALLLSTSSRNSAAPPRKGADAHGVARAAKPPSGRRAARQQRRGTRCCFFLQWRHHTRTCPAFQLACLTLGLTPLRLRAAARAAGQQRSPFSRPLLPCSALAARLPRLRALLAPLSGG
jgi:hypothetical protein